LIEQAIELYRSLDDPATLAGAIKSLGNVASDRAAYERRIDRVRRGLPEDRFEAAWAEGRAQLDEAVMRALS
jgi:hypothetical protein